MALMQNRNEAQDLMSETVVIAFEKFDSIRNMSSFKYFLFAIAMRLFKKKWSRKKEFVPIDNRLTETLSEPVVSNELPDVKDLYKAIEQLNADQKDIIVLFELSGFSLQEISDLKHMNLSTVKTNLSRARQELVKRLNPNKTTIKTSKV